MNLTAFRNAAMSGKYISYDGGDKQGKLTLSDVKNMGSPKGNAFMREQLFMDIRRALFGGEKNKTVQDFISRAEQELLGDKNSQGGQKEEALESQQVDKLLRDLGTVQLAQQGFDDWTLLDCEQPVDKSKGKAKGKGKAKVEVKVEGEVKGKAKGEVKVEGGVKVEGKVKVEAKAKGKLPKQALYIANLFPPSAQQQKGAYVTLESKTLAARLDIPESQVQEV